MTSKRQLNEMRSAIATYYKSNYESADGSRLVGKQSTKDVSSTCKVDQPTRRDNKVR